MKQKLMTLLLFLAAFSAFAQSLPRMKDNYVTDAADILSKSELKQLRTDVKSMCDYYSTRIVVGIVSTFGEYDIDEYAGELAGKWDLSDENTMLILVKPKSETRRRWQQTEQRQQAETWRQLLLRRLVALLQRQSLLTNRCSLFTIHCSLIKK